MHISDKKILYVINSLHPGGAEMGLETLINNGMFTDFQLNIVCLTKSDSNLEKRIKQINNIELLFLSNSEVKNKKMLGYIFSLYKVIRKIKPDVVIASLSQSVLVSRLVKLIHPSFRHITFEHNTHFANKFAWYLLRTTDFLTDTFWCDSYATQRSLLTRFNNAKNNVINLFFVNKSIFPKKNYVVGDKMKLMAVGRLMVQKNYPQLFDVVKGVSNQNINVELSIYGDGELFTDFKQRVEEQGLVDRIIFFGFVDNWLSLAPQYDAYILLSDFEGLSIATLEAMSAGLPCIVKPVGELADYVENGVTGITVKTVDEAIDAIIKLKRDDSFGKTLGNNGIKYVAEHYSHDKFIKQVSIAKLDLEKNI